MSRMQTRWTLFRQAHGDDAEACRARETLLRDYYGAVYKYLLGATRDPDSAKELSQTFAIRFIEGRFRRANPSRGRFRDYLKTSLFHMLRDARNEQKHWQHLPTPEALPDPSETGFDEAWRAGVKERAWDSLAREERSSAALEEAWKALEADKPAYHGVLELLRVDPTLRAPQIVERLSTQRGIHVKEDWVRQAKKRAWASFADHLIDEVASTLESGDLDVLEEELIDLDLLKYCQSALKKRRR
ncbi:hypothetical protein [Tautonia plasticadhaerens]|uniref:RNA polymerase sigma factor n=1 Tax=Tautonia plasticadhaerens TaxID=2527974 RepID=A0A518HF41_9BACT|nr:hypothetical protein [Tautonia plasticadhaerens]QDV39467.1 hypothetical protein ElP_74340 [Tautonia plasticadhaerens]